MRMATRRDPEKHKEQVRAANRARYLAVQELIAENQARFDTLYARHAVGEGVTPKPRSRLDAAQIQSQIAELESRLAQIQNSDAPA